MISDSGITQKRVNMSDSVGKPEIGVIGAGSFANRVMLPLLKKKSNLVGIATINGIDAVFADEKFEFSFATTKPERLIEGKRVNTLFVLTRPHLHARQTILGLKSGKHVFVEKPLATTLGELDQIFRVYNSLPIPKPLLMTGFNRRFSMATEVIRKYISPETPKRISIRVNEGKIPENHWIHDSTTGGGRVITEVCPYIDYAIFLAESKVKSVHAISLSGEDKSEGEGISISMVFYNGCSATIFYSCDKPGPGEQIEISAGDIKISITDFQLIHINQGKHQKRIKYRKPDLGYETEVMSFLNAITKGEPSPIPFEEIIHSMITTFRVNTSLREKRTISF